MSYIDFDWRDNNANKSKTRLHLPASASLADFVTLANAYQTVVSAISNAPIVGAKVYTRVETLVNNPASPTSNVYDRLLIIYREDSTRGTITIPSPLPSLFESTGPWQGIRLDLENSATEALLSQLGAVLSTCVLPYDDSPFPGGGTFTGGRTVLE